MATVPFDRSTLPPDVPGKKRRNYKIGDVILRILFWILVIFILIYTVFPFVWALLAAIKPNADISATPTRYLPSKLYWGNLEYVFNQRDFLYAAPSRSRSPSDR
jgi:ABC-type glycerol-3-phosphate transport system permease component